MNLFKRLGAYGIIPVVKLNDPAGAAPLAHALAAGGLPVAEITFRSDAAEESIRRIVREVPEVDVCAGTVLTVETAKRAMEAGAKAVISPGTNLQVVRWCMEQRIPVIPGCATPTELETCIREGLHFIKFFPAQAAGGVAMLKALAGPYGGMRFMPTGGIQPENVRDYLALSNVACCGGSWIAPEKLLDAGDFAAVEKAARGAAYLAANRS